MVRPTVTFPDSERILRGGVVVRVQKFVTSGYSSPFNTVQGVVDLALTRQSTEDSDVVDSESTVDPLWIVLPLCVAIIAVLLFVVIIIVLRSAYHSLPLSSIQ